MSKKDKAKKVKKLAADYGMDALGIIAAGVGAGMGFHSVATQFAHLPGMGVDQISSIIDLFTGKTSDIPNPYFYLHGHDEVDSPYTSKYFHRRHLKSYGGTAFSLVGTAISPLTTGVNPMGIARHASSEVATGIHLYNFYQIAKAHKQSETLSRWLDLVIKMKAIKAATQGVQIAANSLPGYTYAGAGVAAACLGSGVSITQKIAAKTLGGSVTMVSMELHWRAFQEQAILAGSGSGPASRIVKELMSRRHYKLLGGSYDWRAFVKEPQGWAVFYDKLMLL
jgi:hypothetical protein